MFLAPDPAPTNGAQPNGAEPNGTQPDDARPSAAEAGLSAPELSDDLFADTVFADTVFTDTVFINSPVVEPVVVEPVVVEPVVIEPVVVEPAVAEVELADLPMPTTEPVDLSALNAIHRPLFPVPQPLPQPVSQPVAQPISAPVQPGPVPPAPAPPAAVPPAPVPPEPAPERSVEVPLDIPTQEEAEAWSATVLRDDGRLFRSAPPRGSGGATSRFHPIGTALRTLLRQRRRMVLSIVAVALGVGYLAGSLSLLQRVGTGLANQAGASSEPADYVIEGSVASSGPLQEVRRLVPHSLVQIIAQIDGVAAVEPRLESNSTLIIGPEGAPVVALGLTERPLGANFPTDERLNPYRFVGSGRAPSGPTEVVIDVNTATISQVEVGDTVKIAGKTSLVEYSVVGIVRMADGELPAGSSLALFDTDVARELFELGPDDNAIAIAIDPKADRPSVLGAIELVLYADAEISTGAEYAAHRQASLEKGFTMIKALLIGFAALALVVGAFTVANSMALLFDTRRRGFAMLRLMGASPTHLVQAATIEALIGGLVAGVIGVGLGLGIGAAIEWLIQSMGTPLPVAGPLLSWWIPVVAMVIGAAVTVITAVTPARHASSTPPIHAVTGIDDRAEPSSLQSVARIAGSIGATGLAAGVAGYYLAGTVVGLIALGAGLSVGLVLVALPRGLTGVVAATTSAMLGNSVALRRMSMLRSRQARTRAASTTAALLLAAAVVSGLSVLSTSFVESIEGEVTRTLSADLVIDSGTFTKGGLSADLVPLLRRQPGVESVSGYRPGEVYVGQFSYRAAGLDMASILSMTNLGLVEQADGAVDDGSIIVSRQLAEAQGIGAGDVVSVQFQNGVTVSTEVAAVFDSSIRTLFGDVLIDSSLMATNLTQSVDVFALVNLQADAPASVAEDIRELSSRYGAAKVLEPAELVSERAELLRGFGKVIQWMLGFSVVLALIGVANTLQLGVNERRRELGLLRAVGASRRQVLRLVLAEAVALSLVGTIIGIAVGLAGAFGTVKALAEFGLDQFVVPASSLLVVAVVAVGLGLVGAILPAYRASTIPVLEAIVDAGGQGRAGRSTRRATRRALQLDTEPEVPAPISPPLPEPHSSVTAPSLPTRAVPPPPSPTMPIGDPIPQDQFDPDDLSQVPPPSTSPAIIAPPPFSVAPRMPAEPTRPHSEPVDAWTGVPISRVNSVHDPRCFTCGDEPGPGDRCQHCGASVAPVPVRRFTRRDEPSPWRALRGPAPEVPAAPIADRPIETEHNDVELPVLDPSLPDPHGLIAAVAVLGVADQRRGMTAFTVAAALLVPTETVVAAVTGSTLGMVTVAVVTDRRVITVSDRGFAPEVEIFDLDGSVALHGRESATMASITLVADDRVVTIDQIEDLAAARRFRRFAVVS